MRSNNNTSARENNMRIVERKTVYRSAVYPCVTAAMWTQNGQWNISYIRNDEILGKWHRGSETYIRRVWETKYPAVKRPVNYCQCEACTDSDAWWTWPIPVADCAEKVFDDSEYRDSSGKAIV